MERKQKNICAMEGVVTIIQQFFALASAVKFYPEPGLERITQIPIAIVCCGVLFFHSFCGFSRESIIFVKKQTGHERK
jgi:hypothetical protein